MLNIGRNLIIRIAAIATAFALIAAGVAVPITAQANTQSAASARIKSLELSSTPASGTLYAPGDTVDVDVTFTKNVRVARENSNAAQRMLITVNGVDRHAAYAGRVGENDKIHRFSYTLTDSDQVNPGLTAALSIMGVFGNLFGGASATVNADNRIEAVEIQMTNSVFVPVGTDCEARIEMDASAVGSIDVMVERPYTCDNYAADLSIDGLTLN